MDGFNAFSLLIGTVSSLVVCIAYVFPEKMAIYIAKQIACFGPLYQLQYCI